MIRDVYTVAWKEWREFRDQLLSLRRGGLSAIILALIVGYVVFGDQPTLHILVGGSIVVGAGIFIVWRERQLGIERRAARKASTPQ